MYFRPKTEQIFQTHSEIRAAFPETSFPALLTDEIIQDFDVFPITQVTPEYDPIAQEVQSLLPKLVDGVWVQQWEVRELDPEQVDELSNAIRYLLDHPDEARQMGENGRRAVEQQFNWGVEEKKLLALYNDILNDK